MSAVVISFDRERRIRDQEQAGDTCVRERSDAMRTLFREKDAARSAALAGRAKKARKHLDAAFAAAEAVFECHVAYGLNHTTARGLTTIVQMVMELDRIESLIPKPAA